MSTGTEASNMGYGGNPLYSNTDNNLVNNTASTTMWQGSSNETQRDFGMNGISNNVAAAKPDPSKITGMMGGRRYRHSRRRRHSTRRRLRRGHSHMCRCCRCGRRFRMSSRRRRHRRRGMRGGHSQYQNNQPLSWNFSTGGKLTAADSALANPPPYQRFTDCVDNYSHFSGHGFPSKGH